MKRLTKKTMANPSPTQQPGEATDTRAMAQPSKKKKRHEVTSERSKANWSKTH